MQAFPFPLNIGIDICQISRIYRILCSPQGTRFVKRILSSEELARKDARLNILDKVQRPDGAGTPQSHEQLAAKHPDIWSCAAFVAGRCAIS
jgi:holo-[acyl-carrier protein] synthase